MIEAMAISDRLNVVVEDISDYTLSKLQMPIRFALSEVLNAGVITF